MYSFLNAILSLQSFHCITVQVLTSRPEASWRQELCLIHQNFFFTFFFNSMGPVLCLPCNGLAIYSFEFNWMELFQCYHWRPWGVERNIKNIVHWWGWAVGDRLQPVTFPSQWQQQQYREPNIKLLELFLFLRSSLSLLIGLIKELQNNSNPFRMEMRLTLCKTLSS